MVNTMRPDILIHPQIPRPLHGLNPRTLLGQKWWDSQRWTAYQSLQNRCWACGVQAERGKYVQRLEAHECYDINYEKGQARLREVAALCHACHNFIHSERLWWQWKQKKIPNAKIYEVLQHGIEVLAGHLMSPQEATLQLVQSLPEQQRLKIPKYMWRSPVKTGKYSEVPWGEWRLIIDGKEYRSLWLDEAAWRQHYLNGEAEDDE